MFTYNYRWSLFILNINQYVWEFFENYFIVSEKKLKCPFYLLTWPLIKFKTLYYQEKY